MNPMLLTAATDIPSGIDWLFETKYDGFRCILEWTDQTPLLKSRNGNSLNKTFPEILQFCDSIYEKIHSFLPLTLDGELVFLINPFQSDFSAVQLRGRMRNSDAIQKHVQHFPCHYIVFDLLNLNGETLTDQPLNTRKQKIQTLFQKLSLPQSINHEDPKRLQSINVFHNSGPLWEKIMANNGEGLVAKKISSRWTSGKRSAQWLKIKNWRYISVFLTQYDSENGYFNGAVFKEQQIVNVVSFRHGLTKEEAVTLRMLFQTKGRNVEGNFWTLEPSICVTIACIAFDGKHLREPLFHTFDFEKLPANCDWQQLQRQLYPLPVNFQISHPDKPIWPSLSIQKKDYLSYLQRIAYDLLPFLRERLLTVIRYPHGSAGEHFYQKHCPDYAPDYITTEQFEDIRYIVCNDVETLLWLGNQLALEFHVPFQTRASAFPSEIVFDLDPPSVDDFSLAIEAAVRMKALFDQFELRSYVKTSGGKGLQIYLPLPDDTFSYKETRLFTEFICQFLCEQEPRWFTTERLKKNRHNRLYLDYVQHDIGKTIIAPYSPRGHEKGLIAMPLNWDEVTGSLDPGFFTMPVVLDRLKDVGNPFHDFNQIKKTQNFAAVIAHLKQLTEKKGH